MKLRYLFFPAVLAATGCNERSEQQSPEVLPTPSSSGYFEYQGKKFCQGESASPYLIGTAAHCSRAINVNLEDVTYVYIQNGEVRRHALYAKEVGPGSLWVEEQESSPAEIHTYPGYYQTAKDKAYLRLKEAIPDTVGFVQEVELDEVKWTHYAGTNFSFTPVFYTHFQVGKKGIKFERIDCNLYRAPTLTEVVFNDCPTYSGDSGAGLRSAFDESKKLAVIVGHVSADEISKAETPLARDLNILANNIGRLPERSASVNSMRRFCKKYVVPCDIK